MSTAAPLPAASLSTGPPSGPLPIALPDDVATLQSMIVELLAAVRARDLELENVRQRLDLLLQRLYGPRSERFDPAQLLLFLESARGPGESTKPTPDGAEAAAEPPPRKRCRPHGRRRLPQNLQREAHHHQLTAAERLCPGCGRECCDIGSDKSEQLEYRPASLLVVEHFVHKYACPCCGRAGCRLPVPSPVSLLESPRAGSAAFELEIPASVELSEPSPTMSPSQGPQGEEPSDRHVEPPEPATAGEQPALACRVVSAVKPESPIAKGLPGPGLLAHLIVSKWVDHLPLYRLERIYERQGVFLPRSTLCDWMAASAQLLQPLYQLLVTAVLGSRVIHTDDTPVKLQKPPPDSAKSGRFWVYLGDRAHPYNVFDFTPNRKREGPQEFLKDFAGYLQADAFSGYDGLYLPEPTSGAARILEVACNAHARRKFFEAHSSDAARSHLALAYYRQLYELERAGKAAALEEDGLRRMRQDFAVPILEKFHSWLESQRAEVLPKSPMGEAIGYALNNWSALVRYTESGILAIDNNVAEREMKRIAIGRKNWLFVGSVAGGRTAAVLCSFTSTCQRLGIEPWAYLQNVLERLPTTAAEQLAELLPDRWQSSRQQAAAAESAPGTGSPS